MVDLPPYRRMRSWVMIRISCKNLSENTLYVANFSERVAVTYPCARSNVMPPLLCDAQWR